MNISKQPGNSSSLKPSAAPKIEVMRPASAASFTSFDSAFETQDDDREDYEEKPIAIIEEELFKAVVEGNRISFQTIFRKYRPSALLQAFLTFSYVNRSPQSDLHAASKMNMASAISLKSSFDRGSRILTSSKNVVQNQVTAAQTAISNTRPYFTFDADILQDAHELLGMGVSPLNYIQIACMSGDEELASDMADYVYRQTVPKGQKLLWMEFIGKVWGDGNTTLHLASFQGMSDLVKYLLERGANSMKTNGRGYKPVDCADDDSTRQLFKSIVFVGNMPKRSLSKVPSGGDVKDKMETMSLGRNNDKLKVGHEEMTPLGKSLLVSAMKSTDSLPRVLSGTGMGNGSNGKRIHWEPNSLLLDYAKNGELDLIRELLTKMRDQQKTTSGNRSSKIYSPESVLDFNCKSPHTGLTPLHFACSYGHLDVVKFLIEEHKVDVSLRDSEGWSPLHSCIAEIPDPETFPNSVTEDEKKDRVRFLAVLKYLLANPRIDLQAVTEDCETIFDVIKEIDDNGTLDEEIIRLLEEAMTQRGLTMGKLADAGSSNEDLPNTPGNSTVQLNVKSAKPEDSNYKAHTAAQFSKANEPRLSSSPTTKHSNLSTTPPITAKAPLVVTKPLDETHRKMPAATTTAASRFSKSP